MDEPIPSRDLRNRRLFFCVNYATMIGLTLGSMELVRYVAKKIARPRTKRSFCDGTDRSRPWTEPLMNADEDFDDEKSKAGRILNRALASTKDIIYAVAFSTYYIVFFVFLYVLIDVAVYGGLMNTDTGMAWEIWSLAIEFELMVHVCTFLVKTIWTFGSVQQHPVVLVLPSFLPFVGNAVHIYKDHLAQGLCFAAAHCSSGTLKYVGLTLGYLSILSTIVPLFYLLATPQAREGLRAAHWPITEAGTEPYRVAGVHSAEPAFLSWAARKREVTGCFISYCTEEKWIRALKGEVPHTYLHILFCFFFGGSVFMTFAIVLSITKIISIPILRTMVLPFLVREWHCTKDSCRKYLVNYGQSDQGAANAIYSIAKQYHYYDVLLEFFGEYGFVDTERDLVELVRVPGRAGQAQIRVNGHEMGITGPPRVKDLLLLFDNGTTEVTSKDVIRDVNEFFAVASR